MITHFPIWASIPASLSLKGEFLYKYVELLLKAVLHAATIFDVFLFFYINSHLFDLFINMWLMCVCVCLSVWVCVCMCKQQTLLMTRLMSLADNLMTALLKQSTVIWVSICHQTHTLFQKLLWGFAWLPLLMKVTFLKLLTCALVYY